MFCDRSVLWLFLTVPCFGLQCVIVVFPSHTHLLFLFKHMLLVINPDSYQRLSEVDHSNSFV